MVAMLDSVHSVLCFISQPDVQMSLIDACIAAGVKRYAPNEWAAYGNQTTYSLHYANFRIDEATAGHSHTTRRTKSLDISRKSTGTKRYVLEHPPVK